MKYMLALVVMVLGGLAVATVLGGSQAEPGDVPEKKTSETRTAAAGPGDATSGLEGAASRQPTKIDPPAAVTDYGDRYKEAKDVLKEGLATIIRDLVTGDVRPADKADLERRLILLIEEERMGDSFSRSETARASIEFLLKEMQRYMPKEGLKRSSVDPQMLAAISAQADLFALDIRRKLSKTGSGRQHEGSLMAAIEFDAPKGYEKIRWDVIGGFEYRDHMKLPKEVTALDSKKVAVAGYMITLGEVEDIHEFLLVESGWSCCFGIPPDVNQVIEVRIPEDKPGVEFVTTPIAVHGSMHVGEEVEDGFVISVYRITADNVVDIE